MPFTTERKVRARMQLLAESGRVRRWPYIAIAGRGGPAYYTQTRLGFRLLHGPDTTPPAKGAFSPIGIARQQHSHALAEFIVHTALGAHRAGAVLTGFCRENSIRFSDGERCVYPDSAFQLRLPKSLSFGFMAELDNSTERIWSDKDVECWEAKIRTYERVQDLAGTRFRVLVVATKGMDRVRRILDAAARLAQNPSRSLFYGISLDDYLACDQALTAPCFLDHRGRSVALLPDRAFGLLQPAPSLLESAACVGMGMPA